MQYKWTLRIPIRNFETNLINIYRRIVVKTNSSDWIDASEPAIILFSTQSIFHEGEKGILNVKALLSTIKARYQGPIVILLSERAHLNVLALQLGSYQEALAKATYDAQMLEKKLQSEAHNFSVLYWNEFVSRDSHYQIMYDTVMSRYATDQVFRELVLQDVMQTYTAERSNLCQDESAYISHATQDLLEQCVYVLVAVKKGYRLEFYPGRQYNSIQYVNRVLLAAGEGLSHIHTFIAYEKK